VRALGAAGPVVVVHGGGPQATALARRLGHEPRIVAGRRVTTDLDLQIALWAFRGELNARLVAGATARGVPAVGMSGADGGLVEVVRRPPREVDGETVDFGHVGDVVKTHPAVLSALLDRGFVPVVAPVCADRTGGLYNVNADTVALALARALGARALLLVAEVGAVYNAYPDPASRLAVLDAAAFAAGVAAGWIEGGMRPKLEVGFEAVAAGVDEVRVCAPDALADPTSGTRLVA
ncbi:MAG TPA: acetylglutamate kinase, partial [Rhodothermales bacterium]|nr:acetylglutamate kinase [Rhodothermales bacterium]